MLAAGILLLYPFVLNYARKLPPHEYAQALRAPAWFTVAIGGGIALCALWALRLMMQPQQGDQIFIGLPHRDPLLLIDAYTLWGSALLGAALAIGGWVPAARRSLVSSAFIPYPLVLLLAWCALLTLASAQYLFTLLCWLVLLAGVTGLWYALFRPRRRWQDLEVALVLALAAVLGSAGLLWLHGLAHGDTLVNAWSFLLSASPKYTNAAILLLTLGWLGPAVYLPWWMWMRREELAAVWLPAVLLVCVVGHVTLVHLLYLSFPAASEVFLRSTGTEQLFLIKRILGWVLAWGVLALLVGGGWLAYTVAMKHETHRGSLRPLMLVAAGLMLLGLSVGVLSPHQQGAAGLLWLQLTWVGTLCIWLVAGSVLAALSPTEQSERTTVLTACWMALAALVALPPGPGYRGLAALWQPMQQLGVPRALVVCTLVVTGLCAVLLLPRWAADQTSPTPRAGATWGIIGPFALAFLLLALGLFGDYLTPVLALLRTSLQQSYFTP